MPPVAIILALLILLFGLAYLLRRRPWSELVHERLALGAATLGAVAALVFLLGPKSTDETWNAWRGEVSTTLELCPEAEDGAICLSRALSTHPAPDLDGDPNGPADVFFSQVELGQNLRRIPRASDLLWDEFGIDSEEFIGTGYSVPHATDGGERSYADARQREFFVDNLCADMIDTQRCPTEVDTIWTWRLTPAQASQWLDRPLRALLNSEAPADHRSSWLRARSNEAALNVRFARFNPDYYTGTLGRPDASLVFIAAYPPGNLTLREALLETGSAALAEPGEANETLFIWVYAPEQRLAPATWGTVFDSLRRHVAQSPSAVPAPSN